MDRSRHFLHSHEFRQSCPLIKPDDVARARAKVKDRAQPWTAAELTATLPQLLTGRKQWKVTASHNPLSAPRAIDGGSKHPV